MNSKGFIIAAAFMITVFAGAVDSKAGDWRDYYTWKAEITQNDGSETAKLTIGSSTSATDGYDALYEADAFFAGYLRSYFYHPEWNRSSQAGGTDYFWSDIRSANMPQTYDFAVKAYRTGNVTVTWDVSATVLSSCKSVALTLTDNAIGSRVNMTDGSNYVYNNTSSADRSFTVNASEVTTSVASPSITVEQGEKRKRKQRVVTIKSSTPGATFELYRQIGNLSVEHIATLVDSDKDGNESYVERSSDIKNKIESLNLKGKERKSVKIKYSVKAVLTDGCESNLVTY